MQMLHGAYNLQNWQESDELKELWEYLALLEDDEVLFKKLEEPIVTRWWLVGACACSFKESINMWQRICRAIRNSAPSGTASSKIASCTLNLMNNKVILNDLELLVAFHSFFLFTHFKFMQDGDKECGGTPGFIARHMTVRYFLMVEDLESVEDDKWR